MLDLRWNIRVFFRILVKNFKMETRYPADLLALVFRPLIAVLPYMIFTDYLYESGTTQNILSMEREQIQFYILISVLYLGYFVNSVSNVSMSVETGLQRGILEPVLICPVNDIFFWISETAAGMIFMLMPQIVICIIVVCMFSIPVSLYSLGCVCLVGVETVFLAIGLGVLVSGLTIRTKLTKVTFLLLSLIEFFAGQVYPIAVFPLPLRVISYLNPVTYLLDLLRYAIIGSEPLMNVTIEILWSLFCTLFLAVAGIFIYRRIIFTLKENGGLTNY